MKREDKIIPIIPQWSASKLKTFGSCKFEAYLRYGLKIPEPERPLPPGKTEHANDRGSRIHEAAEAFVRGTGPLIPELKKFEAEFESMKLLLQDGMVSLEGEWAMDRKWAPVPWNGGWEKIDNPEAYAGKIQVLKKLPPRGVAGCDEDGDEVVSVIKVGKQHWLWVAPWLRLKLDAIVFLSDYEAVVIDYKGLPLGTMLPTPTGWTTMAEIAVGDQLVDREGHPCTVSGKSKVKELPCYRITFDDTSIVVCDEEHRWTLADGSVKEVRQLAVGDFIPTAEPLELPEQDLLLDPYVLGIWLADGKHTSGEISKPDRGIWEEIERRGFKLSHDYNGDKAERCRTHTVLGLRTALNALDLLGDKQIPQQYLRGSYQQRLDLLHGLFDGDGSANHTRKQAVLNTTRLDFAEQVKELLLSLGQRPLISPYKAHGFGKDVRAYVVSFRPRNLNPFLLKRKADKVLRTWGIGESWRRRVQQVELVPTVRTQCVMVDSPDHTFLCTENFIPTHNTGRRFGNEIAHAEQTQLYQLVSFLRYPKLEIIHTELWYLDLDEMASNTFDRVRGLRFLSSFTNKGKALTDLYDVSQFPPSPNIFSCRFCCYGSWGTGHCVKGVKK